MCIISTGFPIGYHIMSASIFSSIEQNGWQLMKRHIALIELFAIGIFSPFFTTKYLQNVEQEYHRPSATVTKINNRRIYFSLTIIIWMLGIFTTMSAVNNFLLHLVGFPREFILYMKFFLYSIAIWNIFILLLLGLIFGFGYTVYSMHYFVF